ncbi:hypothetical protein KCU95_g18274, partial [Aureobasidium melanogenum]
MTHLEHLEFSQCRYEFDELLDLDSDPDGLKRWFRLPSGLYELKCGLACDKTFCLAPSGDENEVIVLTDQTSISGQLKSLAAQVAQMERDKIAEIERDGYVRTDIVGMSPHFESEDDIVPGVDDDENMEDVQIYEIGDDYLSSDECIER